MNSPASGTESCLQYELSTFKKCFCISKGLYADTELYWNWKRYNVLIFCSIYVFLQTTQNGTIALNSGTIYVPSTFINMLSDIENAGK